MACAPSRSGGAPRLPDPPVRDRRNEDEGDVGPSGSEGPKGALGKSGNLSASDRGDEGKRRMKGPKSQGPIRIMSG
ncbi:unnamed protein product [Acanthocheilonema viteae]|uniref:Uncharacterized protein n=1 Tax=Acanthocheilonema viteae TaxID=6277 RepID=A0A498SXK2_ACAVI|nr:unnamed protein product [Acanthocheilonema viteae]